MSSHTDTNAPMGITRITNTLAAMPLIIDLGFKTERISHSATSQ